MYDEIGIIFTVVIILIYWGYKIFSFDISIGTFIIEHFHDDN